MKIIGGRDYYDGLMATDRETTPVYVRHSVVSWTAKPVAAKDIPAPPPDDLKRLFALRDSMPDLDFRFYAGNKQGIGVGCLATRKVVSFCGKLHVGYVWGANSYKGRGLAIPEILERPDYLSGLFENYDETLYSFDEIWRALKDWKPKSRDAEQTKEDILEREHKKNWLIREPFTPKAWAKFQANYSDTEVSAEVHRRIAAPVFQLYPERDYLVVRTNPELGPMGFARHYDPFTAYQMLDQYMSNQMAQQNDPLPMDDKYRRDAHGFDDKSFKQTAPGEKKARRAAKKKKKS